ncbi:hypothetical protein AXF42_Ash002628 [Apostasia shenzhenica]|uniref:TLDc domain-containing protein n=1 Tax=Apostasia shenzhenica TaxID=1088818 RepID=A0A2I0AP56_9ASPA|nr:hypothetical protein AXF42_Ash002628 [Apostasia shenzhenica]
MGNAQSPPANPRFALASRAFTQQELDGLKSLFVSLAAQSQSNSKCISPSVFKAYFGIRGPLATRMFKLVSQKRNDDELTYEDLVITKAVYEKGSRNEIDEFLYELCDVNGDGILGRCDLEAVMHSISDSVFHRGDGQTSLSSWKIAIEAFLDVAEFSKEVEKNADNSMSLVDFRNWCILVPSVKRFLGSIMMPPDKGRLGFQVPVLLHPASLKPDGLILQKESLKPDGLLLQREYAWHIAGALSQAEAEQWKLLYHSALNGLSFTTFMGNISSWEWPTILVIKDSEGYVYGGYASQPWERHSDFYGDVKSFLFKLYPQASIFRPSGANNNLQWCAVNFSSDNIPNGIGFGGRASHFGLFLSANFDDGHTFPCTTFNSPCLSRNNRIQPVVIECWGVVVKGVNNAKAELVKGTVLERFKEDRNMLKMIGLANASE